MKILSIAILSCTLLFSCGANKEKKDAKKDGVAQTTKMEKAYIGIAPKTMAEVSITEVTVVDNVMKIGVSYSGGCKDHDFDLVGSENIAKSLPAQRGITLVHKMNDDTCRELITETLEFNIEELAYKKETGSEIILLLNGYKGKISYVFK